MKDDNIISLAIPNQKDRPLNHQPKPNSIPNHQPANRASWWFDFWTMTGRKSENQDSLLITTILTGHQTKQAAQPSSQHSLQHSPDKHPTIAPNHLPVLAVLADGVSVCQFPKQASRMAVEILTDTIIEGLHQLYEQSDWVVGQFALQAYKTIFDDESVAAVIRVAVTKANDAMYFSQAYQRVPPLLSTLSGVLCIGDRVHILHTGDSRIYRVGAHNLTQLSEDHRIHHGQDKGALSAALGADARVDLQQAVLTLHQNEYIALMTDGVYEFINPVEMQFEFSAAVAHLDNTPNWTHMFQWQLSQQLCQLAHSEGSNDNLSMLMLGMGMPSTNTIAEQSVSMTDHIKDDLAQSEGKKSGDKDDDKLDEDKNKCNKSEDTEDQTSVNKSLSANPAITPNRYQLPTGLNIGDEIDGFEVVSIIARTARSEVYLVHNRSGQKYVLKSPSLMTVDDGNYLRDFLKERKIGLSLSKHRHAGESAYNQTNPNHNPFPDNLDSNSLNSNQPNNFENSRSPISRSGFSESGLLRYYPVPASSTYLYHLTEYIEGESLRMFMQRNGPCDVWQTHDLLTKIGMAVRVMHRNYLLHQDIKPENILLTKTGAVKLIDFGSTGSSILKDNTRPPVGDLHYAAPEYYTDVPKGVHSDLFSIAVIGYELLTGELPFTSQILMNAKDALVVPTEVLRQKRVPATSQQALLRALHKNPNVRYQAIGEFLQDFNPDNSASLADPEPLIISNPLLVWHGICLIQSIVILFLLIKFLA